MRKALIPLACVLAIVAGLASIEPAGATYYTMQDGINQIVTEMGEIDSLPGMSIGIDSLVTLLSAVRATDLDSIIKLVEALGGSSLDSIVYHVALINIAEDSALCWADSADARYAAFITWYDSIGTLTLANTALLTTANTWLDSTAYLQDSTLTAVVAIRDSIGAGNADLTLSTASLSAIETDAAAIEVLNTAIRDSIGEGNADLTLVVPDIEEMRVDLDAIASDNDSIMKMLAVPATRRIDASADWSNATLTRAIHTVGADTFQGHFWSFALANDAAAACTLWTYCDGVADQGNDGWPIKPGESVGHLTNYPAPIDSFSFSKTAADLLKWIIIGR